MSTSTISAREAISAPVRAVAPIARRAASISRSAIRRRYRRQYWARALKADLLHVIAWSSVAASVALFLAFGGLATFTSLASSLTSLGIVSGLVATDLMCLMLLLAARIPFVDRAFGHDHAVAVHSRLGKWVLCGLLLHAWFLICGYAASEGITIIAEWLSMWSIGDYVLAVVGLGALAVVAISSIVAVKRRMSYEVWHVIHLITYAAVAASIPHQFSQSGLFAEGNWQRWYWIGLYGATAFALLAFRILLPLFNSIEHRLVVSDVVREADDVVTITMRGRNLPALDVEAGQFFHWRFLGRKLWWHQHPFSVSAAPTRDSLRITVRSLGKGTAKLMKVKPGTRVMIEGPYGIFSDKARTTDAVTLVGIGIGIAPIRAVLEATDFEPGHATVVLRAHNAGQLYLAGEIADLCRQRGAKLVTLVGRRGRNRLGEARWVPASHQGLTIAEIVPGIATSDVFVCGPQDASDSVIAEALEVGTPPRAIHNERFSW